ncbi:MAG: FTR1 family protein [Bacteroidia bacterium]|nr:FTR1 family protein [Bacteroidia bacterium]
MNEFLITFRETLEAALIVGIVWTVVKKSGHIAAVSKIWLAVFSAVILSILAGLLLEKINESIGNEGIEKLYEGLMMYLAGGFLIYMIVWMAKNSNIKVELEQKVSTVTDGSYWAIFSIVFFAIMREGFETAIFLFASNKIQGSASWFGAISGILAAVGIGYLIFVQGQKLPIKKFFNISSVLLILLAGGMVAYGTHEVEEAFCKLKVLDEKQISRPYDILKPTENPPTNLQWIYTEKDGKYYHWFHDKGLFGEYLKGFLGYNSNPNWIEFFLWFLTIGISYFLWKKNSELAAVPKAG